MINRTNKRQRRVIFYDSASVIVYMTEPLTEKLVSCYKVKGFSSLLVCFAFIFYRVMTFIRYMRVFLRLESSIVLVVSRTSLYRGSVPYILL